jgi:hypothetical protein
MITIFRFLIALLKNEFSKQFLKAKYFYLKIFIYLQGPRPTKA